MRLKNSNFYTDLLLNGFEPIFGPQALDFVSGEEAQYRRAKYLQVYSYEAMKSYLPIFVEVSGIVITVVVRIICTTI